MSRASVPLFIGFFASKIRNFRRPYRPALSMQIFRQSLSETSALIRLLAKQEPLRMLYAILCYHDEDFVGSWTKEQDAAVMNKLAVVQDKLARQGRLGPVVLLLPKLTANMPAE